MNVFTFSGNVGNCDGIKYLPSGSAICEFSVAVSSGWGDKRKTSWIKCKLFGKRAESIGEYIVKGMPVTVSGEFTAEEWEDQDGSKRITNAVFVKEFDLPPKSKDHSSEPPMPQEPGGTGGYVPF